MTWLRTLAKGRSINKKSWLQVEKSERHDWRYGLKTNHWWTYSVKTKQNKWTWHQNQNHLRTKLMNYLKIIRNEYSTCKKIWVFTFFSSKSLDSSAFTFLGSDVVQEKHRCWKSAKNTEKIIHKKTQINFSYVIYIYIYIHTYKYMYI